MNAYFFRVEHDLLRSEAFKSLGGSAIKVYLVIGLYSDFGTDWAYPSIRTIAKQAGLSRQTVLAAVEQLTEMGLLAASKAKGRSTAYRIIRQAPQRPPRTKSAPAATAEPALPPAGPLSLDPTPKSVPNFLDLALASGPEAGPPPARAFGPGGREARPEQDPTSRDDQTTSVPIPGTPFRLTASGRLLVAVDLQELLTREGIPGQLARRLVEQSGPEAVAKVLLNALYLQSQGKLQNGPGYIRAGIEDGYELLPQVANRLESRRRELNEQIQKHSARERQSAEAAEQAAEQAAVAYLIEQLSPERLDQLVQDAVALLPEPLVRRNRTLSNPFVRAKVYELACGAPHS